MPKAVIIGAGPAGSAAAILLSQAGIAVTLVEQHRFPRDKVCGECLSALGVEVLGRCRVGLPPNVVTLERALFFSPSGGAAEFQLSRPMVGISRRRLDSLLLDAARDAGAKVLQPARCESAGEREIVIRRLESNEVTPISVDFTLIATGKSSANAPAPRPTGNLGLKAHFVDVKAPRDAIEIFGVSGHYGGIAPIEEGRFNVAFSVPRARIQQHKGDLDACFAAIALENRELERQMRRARRVGAWLVSPLPRFKVRTDWPGSIIPIGNAAAAIEPIGGEGMGLALRSAELAANEIIASSREKRPVDSSGLQRDYQRLWRLRGIACRAAALAVSSPRFCDFVMPFLKQRDDVTAFALRAIGKA